MKRAVLIIAVLVIITGFCGIVAKRRYERYQLLPCLQYIEAEYSTEIEIIERNAEIVPYSSEDMDLHEQITETVRRRLASSDIWEADWSDDGHHGVEMLKRGQPPLGSMELCRSTGYESEDGRHRLFYGCVEGERPCLIYEGRLPTAKKGAYRLVFRTDHILSKMKAGCAGKGQ